jgi:hypothetical protein
MAQLECPLGIEAAGREWGSTIVDGGDSPRCPAAGRDLMLPQRDRRDISRKERQRRLGGEEQTMKATRIVERGRSLVLALAFFTLVGAAVPRHASAQTLVGGGVIWAEASCYLATNRADVIVKVMNPPQFSSTGLVYYGRIWAKGERDLNWTKISEGQTGVVNTWTNIGGALMNNAIWLFKGNFTGTDGRYDIYVQYWSRLPNASSWGPMYGFSISGDQDSVASVYSNSYGQLASYGKICSL